MSSIAKIVKITPLVKPEVRPSRSLSNGISLAPQKAPRNYPTSFDFLPIPETDFGAHSSNPAGFYDEHGFYYPHMDPETRQFAEKYFSPAFESPSSSTKIHGASGAKHDQMGSQNFDPQYPQYSLSEEEFNQVLSSLQHSRSKDQFAMNDPHAGTTMTNSSSSSAQRM